MVKPKKYIFVDNAQTVFIAKVNTFKGCIEKPLIFLQ